MTRAARVVVLGGGYSGAMTAAQLAARGVATTVIEPGELGRGGAYARTPWPLLLNAPASEMSALPDAPHHFEAWLARRDVHPGSVIDGFAPRAVYGDYLEDTIAAIAAGRLAVVRGRAAAVEPRAGGFAVACDDGRELAASHVVFALGHAPPRRPTAVAPGTPGYLAEPYQALTVIGDADDIALLGSGLTALDVIAALRGRGHRGRIVVASRRGRVPLAHGPRPRETTAVPRELVRQPGLPALLAWWRVKLSRVHPDHRGELARAQLIALRPWLSTIWRRLPLADRGRFLRHVRPHWDVLRHRAPPGVRGAFDRGVAEGSIEVLAGTLAAVAPGPRGLRCRWQVAAVPGSVVHDVRWLVNCTGPERDVRRVDAPVVQALLARRVLVPDPLGLGVLTGPSGQLIGEDGDVSGAFVVGPWRTADLWEAGSVPELRHHAADTARAIAGEPAAGVTGADAAWLPVAG